MSIRLFTPVVAGTLAALQSVIGQDLSMDVRRLPNGLELHWRAANPGDVVEVSDRLDQWSKLGTKPVILPDGASSLPIKIILPDRVATPATTTVRPLP